MITEHLPSRGSFRDPGGRVFNCDGRIIRVVDRPGQDALELVRTSPALRRFIAAGEFVGTHELDGDACQHCLRFAPVREFWLRTENPVLVEHNAVAFPSFPYEWSPGMLHAAGSLTLDVCESLLDEGLGLKDASPFNILFDGVRPVFVDVLSIEKRRCDDPIWLPEAQFVRTFLLPLLASQRWQTPLAEIFITHRDGLQPSDLYRRCGAVERYHPKLLGMVSIPTWLEWGHPRSNDSLYHPRTASSQQQSTFVLRHTFRRLRKQLESLKPRSMRSGWSDYQARNTYSDLEAGEKRGLVTKVIETFRPKRILDIGCNTGAYSAIGARDGAAVVAIDQDEAAVSALFGAATEQSLPILPLIIDIARPTPALGWNNAEQPSFLSRGAGAFEAVFMLAILHHLLVTERIPLPEIVDLAATLTTDVAVIEYVGRTDSMFQRIVRGRDSLHEQLTRELFERECKARFEVIESVQVQHDRWIYVMRKPR